MDLIIATTNAHKIREYKALLKRIPLLDIYTLHDFPDYTPPEETATSFEENALLKATHAAAALNKWILSDDSGLIVPSLLGAPGIYSSRYAGKEATDKDNRKKLLQEMKNLQGIARSAYFECAIALASPDGWTKTVKGVSEGTIALEEKGRYGFGYDPLFKKYDYNQTFAEIDEPLKNQISHRAKAFEKLIFTIESKIIREEHSDLSC